MASPFPRLTPSHFFAPVKCFAFSLSGAKKNQLPRTLGASLAKHYKKIQKKDLTKVKLLIILIKS